MCGAACSRFPLSPAGQLTLASPKVSLTLCSLKQPASISLRRLLLPSLAAAALGLAGCQTAQHEFVQAEPGWETRVGQLQYRSPKTSLIGDVLVRYSRTGDFELTFSKGPGLILLTVRQNEKFVRVSGPLARGSWSGAPRNAPVHLRGWVALREVLLREKTQPLVRQTVGADSFTFAF